GKRDGSRNSTVTTQDAADQRQLALAGEVLGLILRDYAGAAAVELWNGDRVAGPDNAPVIFELRRPEPLRDMLFGKNLNRLAEAYLAGHVGYRGDLERIFDLIDFLQNRHFSLGERAKLLKLLLRMHANPLGVLHTEAGGIKRNSNSQATISHHYDVDNSFYQLVLDPEMIYSCAYFQSQDQDLAAAQRFKLDHICRKLMLQEGERLLDIGCGWGGLAIWAARNYGVRVHGITLSHKQLEYGQARVRELGLDDRITLEL